MCSTRYCVQITHFLALCDVVPYAHPYQDLVPFVYGYAIQGLTNGELSHYVRW